MDGNETISIGQLLGVLRRRRWVLVQTLLVGVLAGVLLSQRTPTEYQASAKLLVEAEPSLLPVGVFSIQRSTGTVAQLVRTRAIAERVRASLGTDEPVEALLARVRTEPDPRDAFVIVEAKGDSPTEATEVANAFAREFVASRSETALGRTRQAVAAVRRQVAALPKEEFSRNILSLQLAQLRVLPTLPAADVKVADPAAAAAATRPQVWRDGLVGLGLGLLLGVVLAFAFEAFDPRLKSVGELNRLLQIPHLASVAARRPRRLRKNEDGSVGPQSDSEPFERLRTSLLVFEANRQLKSILVTSPSHHAEGKTVVAANLAVSFAKAGLDVCVVDADLRRRALATELGLDEEALGLTDALDGAALGQVVQRFPIPDAPVLVSGNGRTGQEPGTLAVVAAGRPVSNAGELLASNRMADVIRELEARHDLVILDCAPVLVASDAMPLAARVSGTLLVARLFQTRRTAATSAAQVIARSHGELLGVVATGVPERSLREEGYAPWPGPAPQASHVASSLRVA